MEEKVGEYPLYLANSVNNNNNNGNNNDLTRLLMIPIENLEQRIKEIEDEIFERLRIRETIFRELEHQRKKLEGKVNQLEYDRFNPTFISRKTTLESQMLSVEQGKLHEQVACFRDIVILREKLRFAKEELKKQREKSKLLLNGKSNGRNKEVIKEAQTGFR